MAACSKADVETARKQTERLLQEAEQLIGPGQPGGACQRQLTSARVASKDAAKWASPLEHRNAFIRAAFHAGQARACAIATTVGHHLKRRKRKSVKKDGKVHG